MMNTPDDEGMTTEIYNLVYDTLPGTSFFWLPWNEKERITVWLAKLRLVHPPAKTARIFMSTDLSRWTQHVCTREVKPTIVFCFRMLKPVSLVRS